MSIFTGAGTAIVTPFKAINNIPNGSILDVKSGATYAHYEYFR